MINKDGGGTIFQFYGGHSCYEGGHRAHGGSPQPPPTRENPVGRGLLFDISVQVGIKDFLLARIKKQNKRKTIITLENV